MYVLNLFGNMLPLSELSLRISSPKPIIRSLKSPEAKPPSCSRTVCCHLKMQVQRAQANTKRHNLKSKEIVLPYIFPFEKRIVSSCPRLSLCPFCLVCPPSSSLVSLGQVLPSNELTRQYKAEQHVPCCEIIGAHPYSEWLKQQNKPFIEDLRSS